MASANSRRPSLAVCLSAFRFWMKAARCAFERATFFRPMRALPQIGQMPQDTSLEPTTGGSIGARSVFSDGPDSKAMGKSSKGF
jgi:hypothetical protein